MKKKNIFDILENAENDSMERIIEKCPEVSDEQLDRIFAKSEKKFRKQWAEENGKRREKNIKITETDIVEGVERSKRPAWLAPLSTAASIVLIAGIALGSTVMLHRNTKTNGGDSIPPAVTVTTSTVTGTNIVSTDQNGSALTAVGVTTTTSAESVTTSADEATDEKNVDTQFIKPFVGKWRYEMSSINDLNVPESVVYMGVAEIHDDATYTYTDNSGNVTHGTISNAAEEIGGTSIQCLDFSENEYSANDFLFNRAYYIESIPYELHFGNSYIARLVREEHVEHVETSWQSAYRKELIELYNNSKVTYNDPMWELQDIDDDGIPELLISTGTEKNDIVFIYYYENGEAITLHEMYTVDRYGEYGVTGICKEDHLIGWIGIFDNYKTTNITKFEDHKKTEDLHYNYSDNAASYGGDPYALNSIPISEEEYNEGIERYNSKNWVTVGRQYNLIDLSPLH